MTPQKNQPRGYGYSVSECNFDYCMHFSEKRRRCSLRKCFYDRKNVDRELKEAQLQKRHAELEGAEEWPG